MHLHPPHAPRCFWLIARRLSTAGSCNALTHLLQSHHNGGVRFGKHWSVERDGATRSRHGPPKRRSGQCFCRARGRGARVHEARAQLYHFSIVYFGFLSFSSRNRNLDSFYYVFAFLRGEIVTFSMCFDVLFRTCGGVVVSQLFIRIKVFLCFFPFYCFVNWFEWYFGRFFLCCVVANWIK